MATTTQRIEIGFEGGPVVELRLDDAALESIRSGLTGGGWQRVSTEDGDVDLNLDRIVFLKTASSPTKVGF